MKLRYSPLSPFVRKVRVVALETGLHDRLELIPTVTADPAAKLWQHNPLIKIPALVLESGESLYDSIVICEYLDSLHSGQKMFPASGPARWTALRRHALADGIMEAALLRRYESLRPKNLQSADWDATQKSKVDHGLAALEDEVGSFDGLIDISTLSTAVMLDYLNFRFGPEDWASRFPKLATWHKVISARPSLATTLPKE
ncbi:MAG TPA: glutathione S-transferase N-terminal domain-containing protein [Terriglobia bacterium]|nr:glutathione S-transferase N-terminal domain-containing protein [Terriglobia bacterium]